MNLNNIRHWVYVGFQPKIFDSKHMNSYGVVVYGGPMAAIHRLYNTNDLRSLYA
jgi:hypothetical protein